MPDSRSSVLISTGLAEDPEPLRLESGDPFRILIAGDFSGRSNRGLKTDLAGRHPIQIDRDNFDEVMAGFQPTLDLPGQRLTFLELDDFHPDHLSPRLSRPVPPALLVKPPVVSNGSLLDQMLEETDAASAATPEFKGDLAEFLRTVISPKDVEARKDPAVSKAEALLQSAAAFALNSMLHHAEFQALEAVWRSVEMLVRGLNEDVRIFLFDATLPELAADPQGVARLLAPRAPWSLIAGNYVFGHSAPYAGVLAGLAKSAAAGGAPFLAESLPPAGDGEAPEWTALRCSPEARFVGLAMPRFLLRLPYGKETSPVDGMDFEEMPTSVHEHYLWGNPAFCCAYLLAEGQGKRRIEGLPLHVYREDGESKIKPCAEVLLTEHQAEYLLEQGIMPLATLKGQDAAMVVRFQSIASPLAALAGRWT